MVSINNVVHALLIIDLLYSLVCTHNCWTGFISDNDCFECILNDSCAAFTPCQNGGTCILDTAPDQFCCDCTNSYDPDTNCSG